MKIRGVLVKEEWSIWDNDRGNDITGYFLTIKNIQPKGSDRFRINEKTMSGKFFKRYNKYSMK